MAVQEKLASDVGKALSDADAFTYRTIVGGLQYLTLTHPDIAFVVNKVCQYLSAPRNIHWEGVKRILCSVKGTASIGVCFRCSSSILLSVFTDADWPGCPDDKHLTSSFAVFFGPNLIYCS